MGFSLLAPLFLAGLAAVAVPILVHLTARDRRDVLRFPSLKFLTRLPYRQARRQRLKYPLLLALRILAVVLLVLAFTRPFFDHASVGALDGPGREVVIALDRSYSMGYGDTWEQAIEAARDAAAALPSGSRSSLITFDGEAVIQVAPTTDPQAIARALDGLAPSSGSTRFAPALRLAEEILLDSPRAGREVVLVSDLQAEGWERSTAGSSEPAILPAGVKLTAVDSSARDTDAANVLISDVATRQRWDGTGIKVTFLARLIHRGANAITGLPISVHIESTTGEVTGSTQSSVELAPTQSATVRLGPIDLPPGFARATVRIGDDPLPADNVFHLTITPRKPTRVLLIEAPDARDGASLYLREALTVSHAEKELRSTSAGGPEIPAFDLRVKRATEVSPADIETASVIIIHDSPFPTGAAGTALTDHVAAGGGLWCALGSRSQLPEERLRTLLPGLWRGTVDRLASRGSGLAGIDYDHPVFKIFAGADDGNLAAPRLYRYRSIELTDGIAVARTTDGAVALAERKVGKGRVLLWGSPFDNRWSNLPVQAVFLPFVHQAIRYLADERTMAPWHQVGQALDLSALVAASGVEHPSAGPAIVETPSGARHEVALDTDHPSLPLDEAGFYDITLPGHDGQVTRPVAVNVDPAESDLTKLDSEAFVAASTADVGTDTAAGLVAVGLTRDQRERRQGVWWFLLLGVLLLLAVESVWSNVVPEP